MICILIYEMRGWRSLPVNLHTVEKYFSKFHLHNVADAEKTLLAKFYLKKLKIAHFHWNFHRKLPFFSSDLESAGKITQECELFTDTLAFVGNTEAAEQNLVKMFIEVFKQKE